MSEALSKFEYDQMSVTEFLWEKILGHNEGSGVPTDVFVSNFSVQFPGNVHLNAYQNEAVRKALSNELTLIQGPPGTGKTVTSAAIVYNMRKKYYSKRKVLVCAPSNTAADHLAITMLNTGLKVIRVMAFAREQILITNNELEKNCLHVMLQDEFDKRKISETQRRKRNVMRKIEQKMLSETDVVVTTCCVADDVRLKQLRFPIVLIDEVTQAIEPECIIPILKGCQHLIMVGDQKQLGPVVLNSRAEHAGLKKSLFERMIQNGYMPTMLNTQYRMHPELNQFSSDQFYNSQVQDGVTTDERTLDELEDFPFPNAGVPMMFINVEGEEQNSATGHSYINYDEIESVSKVIEILQEECGLDSGQIGVITPYKGQVVHLQKNLYGEQDDR